jgi:hypothetical protein
MSVAERGDADALKPHPRVQGLVEGGGRGHFVWEGIGATRSYTRHPLRIVQWWWAVGSQQPAGANAGGRCCCSALPGFAVPRSTAF